MTVPYAGFIVNPSGLTATVSVTNANGTVPTCYTNSSGAVTQTNPATITTPTGFFVAAEGPYVLSVKVAGIEQNGNTYVLEGSQVVAVGVGSTAPPITTSNLVTKGLNPITGCYHASAWLTDLTGSVDQTANMVSLVNTLNTVYTATGIPQTILLDQPCNIKVNNGNTPLPWKPGVSLYGANKYACSLLPYGNTTACIRADGPNDGYTTGAPLQYCDFYNFTINGTNQPGSTYSVSAKGFAIQYMQNVHFRDLRVINCIASGIGVDYPLLDVTIESCYVNGNGRLWSGGNGGGAGLGLGVENSNNVRENFHLINNECANNGSYGIFVESQSGSPVASSWNSNSVIVGNVCYSNGKSGIGGCGQRKSVISSNICFSNTQHGIAFDGGTLSSGHNDLEAMIVSNECYLNTGSGILFDVTQTGANNCKSIVVGNNCNYNTLRGIHLLLGSVTDLQDFKVSSNQCYYNVRSGIYASGGTNSLSWGSISFNDCKSNGSGAVAGDRDGINIQCTCTNVNIVGNECHDRLGSKTQAFGLVINAAFTGGSIRDNDFQNNLTGAASVGSNVSATTWLARNGGMANPFVALAYPGTGTAPTISFPSQLMAAGGTVTAITLNGTQIASSTPIVVDLEPGDNLIMTSSVNPTTYSIRGR